MTQLHSSSYFDRFPGFQPDPERPIEEEFADLADSRGWITGSKRYRQERGRCLRAEYEFQLGSIDRSRRLEDWQALCQELRINSLPSSITQCKKVRRKCIIQIYAVLCL